MEELMHILSYPFMQRALIVGILVSLCSALLGVVLVLKKYSLIGHGLSEVGFGSLALALALGLPPLQTSIPILIISSFLIMAVSQKKGIQGDVAIGVASTASLALGILLISYTAGFTVDIYNYMFGSILAMNKSDIYISIILAILVIGSYVIFYNRIFIITSDEEFAKASGINVTMYQFLISLLTALTIAIGIRLMGTLLISSLIIFPAISAQKIVSKFKLLIIFSAIISIFCFLIGMYISFILNLPTGASIVIANIIVMILLSILGKFIKL